MAVVPGDNEGLNFKGLVVLSRVPEVVGDVALLFRPSVGVRPRDGDEHLTGSSSHVRVAFGALDVECFSARSTCLRHRCHACVELGIGMHFHRCKWH